MDNDRLIQKLGLRLGQRAYTLHAPVGYAELLHIPEPINSVSELDNGLDWLQAFYADKRVLASELDALKNSLAKHGQLWLSWPKKASNMVSDVDQNVIHKLGLQTGLVDVKIASINETWSGLKFVYRLRDR